LSTKALAKLVPPANRPVTVSMLDIGTGAADIPAALIERFAERGVVLTVHAIDAREEMVELATERVGERPDLTLAVTTAAERLPYADGDFDVVHSSMVVHHLEPTAAIGLLREAARVGVLGVVVNDLDRTRMSWLGAWLLSHLLTRNPYTRHDAPLSVRRAYRPNEVEAMAAAAGLKLRARVGGLLGYRYALVFTKVRARTEPGVVDDG
jgi:2-polyprenyl-3-methyl-5-hydroxy-6-metoxy-1,4-benzoquinol methylase